MRGPVSNRTSVAGMAASSRMRARRAVSRGGEETGEKKPVGRQPGHRECREHGGRVRAARSRDGPPPAPLARASTPDRRRAACRHPRPARPRRPAASRARSFGRAVGGIVVVVGDERRRNSVALEQPPRHPRILAGDHLDSGQRLQRAQRHIAEIADRRCHQIEAGGHVAGCDLVPEDAEMISVFRPGSAARSGRFHDDMLRDCGDL